MDRTEVPRADPPLVAGERESLDGWLDYHRSTLLTKCQGLTGEQLARRAVPPSTLSLLGLVRHMAEVERAWFRRRVAGQTGLGYLYSTDEYPDGDFDLAEADGAEADFAALSPGMRAGPGGGRGPIPGRHVRARTRRQHLTDLRWVYLHMIEEYARHNGHADLLREQIDGVTGD